jgi:hypothetical protein
LVPAANVLIANQTPQGAGLLHRFGD